MILPPHAPPDSAEPVRLLRRFRFDVVSLAALLALGAGIVMRCYRLGTASLWFDEGYTAWAVSLSAHELLRAIRVDTSPPLFYLLLHGWTLALGRSEAAMRAMSALCASLAVLLLVPVAKRLLHDRRATAAAVTLFSLGYLQVSYAHEARFYALMTLEGVAALGAVLRAIDHPGWRRSVLVLTLWTASLYTNNLMALYVAATAFAWWALPGRTPRRQRVRSIVVAGVATVALFSPWAPTLLQQSHAVQAQFWIHRPDGQTLVRAIAVLIGVNEQGVEPLPPGVLGAMLVLLVIAIGVALLNRRTRATAVALSAIALGPIVLVFVLSRLGRPIFLERSFLASSPVLALLLALPATLDRWPRRAVLAITLVIAFADVRSWQHHWSGEYAEDWRSACACAKAAAGPKGRIVFVANEGEMLYDFYARHSDYTPSPRLLGAPRGFFAIDPPRTLAQVRTDSDLDELRQSLAASPAVPWVLVESHREWADADDRVLKSMKQLRAVKEVDEFWQVTVYRF